MSSILSVGALLALHNTKGYINKVCESSSNFCVVNETAMEKSMYASRQIFVNVNLAGRPRNKISKITYRQQAFHPCPRITGPRSVSLSWPLGSSQKASCLRTGLRSYVTADFHCLKRLVKFMLRED